MGALALADASLGIEASAAPRMLRDVPVIYTHSAQRAIYITTPPRYVLEDTQHHTVVHLWVMCLCYWGVKALLGSE